jgi:hypothetical protein
MAKVPYSKLKCKINDSIKEVKLNDEVTIEVKQYLPIQEKLELIGRVIEFAHEEDRSFSNPVKAQVISTIEIICAYTNIVFTDKQKENIPKLYDSLFSSGMMEIILENIPVGELNIIEDGIKDSIKAVYEYQNSILGVLETVNTDYSNLNIDLEDIQNKINDPNSLELVKNVLTKLN